MYLSTPPPAGRWKLAMGAGKRGLRVRSTLSVTVYRVSALAIVTDVARILTGRYLGKKGGAADGGQEIRNTDTVLF